MGANHKHPAIAPEKVAEVIRRIKAGKYRCDIARAVRISEYAVRTISIRNKLTIAACPRGSRWGGLKREKALQKEKTVVVEPEKNWRAIAANARWLGGRESW